MEKNDFEFKKILEYISVWNWHLTAVVFFIGAVILFFVSTFLSIIFIAAFIVAEIISMKKKNEFYKE